MLHQVTLFHKIVEVARQIDHFSLVVVGILIVRRVLDAIDQGDEVLISDRKLLKQTILLEETEAKVDKDVFSEHIAVLKDVEVPLFELVHDLEDLCPLARVDIDDLTDALLVFLKLGCVRLSFFTMQLFKEVVKVSLEP